MDFFTAMDLSASALGAQRMRMNVISSNLANIHSTKTPEGGPYQKREVVFSAVPVKKSFGDELQDAMNGSIRQCEVTDVVKSQAPFRKVFNPHHPHADAEGYVSMPNVELVTEMANMMDASRAYEANLAAIDTAKNMAMKALEIGR
ncbi:MAG: flagellar basal body rod protein FlgC [Deltaproteobacteria bacterium]|nr:flagellar basal body rod protein FlgC [Deltaproteobacteria bacterium]